MKAKIKDARKIKYYGGPAYLPDIAPQFVVIPLAKHSWQEKKFAINTYDDFFYRSSTSETWGKKRALAEQWAQENL